MLVTDHENINATGTVDFGDGKVFAVDSDNGLIALTLEDHSAPAAGSHFTKHFRPPLFNPQPVESLIIRGQRIGQDLDRAIAHHGR